MNWESVEWSEVLEIKNGRSQKKVVNDNGEYPIYGSGGLMGYADDYLCEAGTTIIGRKGSINNPIYVSTKFWNVDTAFGLAPGERLDDKYFYYFCLTYNFLKHNKATTLPSLTKSDLLRIKIPLPPLPVQKRIAAILDAADAYRQKTKALIEKYDQLTQSLFLEMFGDPVRNEKGWENERLENLAEINSGVTKGRNLRGEFIQQVPYMRVANVQDGYLDLSEVKTIPATENDLKKYKLEPGDVLLTEGGDPDKLGRGTVWNGEVDSCIHQNHIFRVRISDSRITPLYLSKLCSSQYGKLYFLKSAKQTTGIASINKTQLKGFPVLLADLSIQNRFLRFYQETEQQKLLAQESLIKAQELFQSLLQRAFKGEL